MKKIVSIIILLMLNAPVFAQNARIPQIYEIAQIEKDGDLALQVFSIPKDGQQCYYLDAGTLGIGDKVIQIQIDPLYRLFIPLGETLTEALETLGRLQDLYKEPVGTVTEISGCFAPAFPNESRETVTITSRKLLLSRMLEFSIERDGYIRATHITKSDLGSLITTVKLYRKIHPKEL